jgi:anti-sigma B factor antagonist
MDLELQKIDGVAVVLIVAENLDASNTRAFKQRITPILESETQVALDCSKLQFVDSSGIGAILACLRRINARGGDVRLFGITRPVRALFELVRMHRIFEIFNSRDEAVRSFQ